MQLPLVRDPDILRGWLVECGQEKIEEKGLTGLGELEAFCCPASFQCWRGFSYPPHSGGRRSGT